MRYTCSWRVGGTKTFRLGSGKFLGQYGGNCQNTHEALMRCIIPDENKVFVQADQRAAEALIMAYLAPPGRMRDLILNGIKPHTYLALHIFADQFVNGVDKARIWKAAAATLRRMPEWDNLNRTVSKSGIPYFIGKKTIHSRNYGMGWATYQRALLADSEGSVNITAAEAKAFLGMWDELFPEILQLQTEIIQRVDEANVLHNLFGYPRLFTQPPSPERNRDALSFIPQSTVGCITHRAITWLQNEIETRKLNWDILNNKHDSLLIQCPESEVQRASMTLIRSIEQWEFQGRDTKFRMGADIKVGMNWADFHPQDNPEGMKEAA